MNERRVLIIETRESSHGAALREILAGAAAGFVVRAEPLVSPTTNEARLREAAVEFEPVFVFVLIPQPSIDRSFEGLPGRLGLPGRIEWFLVSEGLAHPEILAALRSGFSDFIVPPLRAADVLPRLLRRFDVEMASDPAVQELKQRVGLSEIIGQSPAFIAELKKLPQLARCEACVLIAGETGTGKELFARAIHYLSPRTRQPFVAVNCGAIPPDLVENELFGHECGAFTGAVSSRAGLIEEAEGGTLFLDEVDSLPFAAQVKLLRLLQEREYRRLGSQKTCRADVRVVAAANTDLEDSVRRGAFRNDLFYRLNVLPLRLPPLRERPEDLPLLSAHFAMKYAQELDRPPRLLTAAAFGRLQQHHWPGNVRELQNVIARAVLLTDGPRIESRDVGLDGAPEPVRVRITFREEKARVVRRFERDYLTALLARHRGNISHAAIEAGKNRRALFELLRKHRLFAREFTTPHSPG